MYKSILLFIAILIFSLSVSARAAVYADSYMASTDDGFYVTGLDDQYDICHQKANNSKQQTACLNEYINRARADIMVSLKIMNSSCNKPECANRINAIQKTYQQFGQSVDDVFNYAAPASTYARLALNATIIKGMQDTANRLATLLQNFDN